MTLTTTGLGRAAAVLAPLPGTATRLWRATTVLAPLAGYVLVTWPWALRLWTQAPGRDGATFVWSFWWMRHALETAQWPLSTTQIYAPFGAPLALHAGLPLPALASVPLQWLVGTPLAFNLSAIVLVVLACVCTTALARDFGLERWPALFAGLAFAFAPAVADRYAYLGHLNLSTTFWIPLLLLTVRRWQRAPTWRRGAVLGAALAGAVWSDQTIAILAALAAALYLVAALVTRRLSVQQAALGGLVPLAVAGVLAAPLVVSAALGFASGTLEADQWENGARTYSNDLAGLLVGNPENPVIGRLVAPLAARMGGRWDGANDLGVVIFVLALVGLVAYQQTARARWLALLAVVAVAISLGPVLWISGRQFIPLAIEGRGEGPVSALMPFTWIQRMPLLSGLRSPGRFSLLAALPLALLAGFGVQRLGAVRGRALLVGAVAVPLLLIEAASPVVNRLDVALPDVYQRIAADPDPDVIVLDVPLGFNRGVLPVGSWWDGAALASTRHGKPTAAGYISRLGDSTIVKLMSLPLYRDVLALQQLLPGQAPPVTAPAEGAASAAEHGIGYAVVADHAPGAGAVRDYLTAACFEPIQRSQNLELFRFACEGD